MKLKVEQIGAIQEREEERMEPAQVGKTEAWEGSGDQATETSRS